MLRNIVKKVVGDPVERALSRYREVVERINILEPELQKLSDAELRAKTDAFKKQLADGVEIDTLLVEAFATVREASVRTIKLRHYDVQMIGGMVLHEGRIAEMKTGEGKTLVATLSLYLNALRGKGAHLITPNDYLSKVGVQTMGPVYHMLGLSVGVIQSKGDSPDPNAGSFIFDLDYNSSDARYQNLRPVTRRDCYHADITYGTNHEFGFDYLRDNMVYDTQQLVQRDLNYAIVDEVDNILIDEARTPLIISGPADEPSDYYKTFAQLVKHLKRSSDDSVEDEEPDGDYVVDEKDRIAFLTEQGVEKIERKLGVDQLYHPSNAEMIPYLDNSLRAHALYRNDKEYIIEKGQVIIVDEFTGRLMYGRRFSEGLHQAIEAKEGVQVRRENLTMATITYQNFFRMYDKLAGMTGTALTEAEEFEKIYDLEVVAIPTNLPVIRLDHDDLIFMTEAAKFRAVTNEIKMRQENGQPILVGTVAVETSERLSNALNRAGISHQVLNAKQHEKEATIIAQAGRPGAVTIATNMAGRGVDILLGGNPDGLARENLRKQGIEITEATDDQWESAFTAALAECANNRQVVLGAGGLFVLGTERHDARRIDNQLRGRSGRQGDPGESRFFLSVEDDLIRRFGGERVKGIMSWANIPEDEPIEHSIMTKTVAQAQVRVEGHNFDIRKRVLEYDDVVNKQREVIYAQRRDFLQKPNLRAEYIKILEDGVVNTLDIFTGDNGHVDEDELETLYRELLKIFPVPEHITPDTMAGQGLDELESLLTSSVRAAYDQKTEELGAEMMDRLERFMMLRVIDQHWQRHLTDLDILREGIGLMSIAQRDPLVEYKRAAFNMWQEMQGEIRAQAAYQLLTAQVNVRQPMPVRQRPLQMLHGGAAEKKPEPVRVENKPGRNDPCWCGSGKKYKHCHLKQDKTG